MEIRWQAIFFWAVAAAELCGEMTGYEPLVWATKPLLMPALALWVVTSGVSTGHFVRNAVLLALAFSTAGDTLLLFAGQPGNGDLFFMAGLSAFLVAHLCYTFGFWALRPERRLGVPTWVLLVLVAYLTLFLYVLWPGMTSGLRPPVAVYAGVISLMAWSVMRLHGYIDHRAFARMLPGALLFVLSDSLIALNKFVLPFAGAHVAIMATYIAGQFLLVWPLLDLLRRKA